MKKNNNNKITKKGKSAGGAPRTYSKDVFIEIINIFANTSIGLPTIISNGKANGLKYPVRSTFAKRVKEDKELSDIYAQAQDLHDEFMAYEALKIADDSGNDYVVNAKGQKVFDKENVHRAKLRVETRFKLLEFLNIVRSRARENNTKHGNMTINFLPSHLEPKV